MRKKGKTSKRGEAEDAGDRKEDANREKERERQSTNKNRAKKNIHREEKEKSRGTTIAFVPADKERPRISQNKFTEVSIKRGDDKQGNLQRERDQKRREFGGEGNRGINSDRNTRKAKGKMQAENT